jgi:hypothetical protein
MSNHAIAIGITNYPSLRPLQGPENDAKDFCNWVVNDGNVAAGNVACITSSRYKPAQKQTRCRPTLEIVDDAFRDLARQAFASGRIGNRLYIFMAGHGFAPATSFGPDLDDAALLMANADLETLGLHVPGGPYANWFRAAAAFDEVLLFMDCCRDDFGRTPVHYPPFAEKTDPGGANVRTLYAYATKWSYSAREKIIDKGEVRGVFSYALMEGLRGKAAESGVVTGSSLEKYVFSRLPKLVGETSYQEPRFYYEKQRDITIVNTPVKTSAVSISWSNLPPEASIELSRANAAVIDRHLAAQDTKWQVSLPIGVYKLQVPNTAVRKLFEVVGEEALDVQLS